jgi:hypothetical protein
MIGSRVNAATHRELHSRHRERVTQPSNHESPKKLHTTNPTTIQAAVDRVASTFDPHALGAEVGDFVIREMPELARRCDEDLLRTVRAAADSTVLDLWRCVREQLSREEVVPSPAEFQLVSELVHRGIDLAAMLRAYRLGHQLVQDAWERAVEQTDLAPHVRVGTIAEASRRFFEYIDGVSVRLAQAYADERAQWLRGPAALRTETVHALLAGQRIPVAKASAALGYDLTARHIGFILWADPEEPDPRSAGSLEEAAGRLAKDLGTGATMLLPMGEWVIWGWVAVNGCGDRASTGRPQLAAGLHAAIGEPAAGICGFVQTHREAAHARRVAALLRRRASRTTHYRTVAMLAMLTDDPSAAMRFVEAELGELASPADAMARIRATLRAYFEESGSPMRTSRRLGINKNTVSYRVARAEEILGHDLLRRRTQLEAALLLHEVLDGLHDVLRRLPTLSP